MSRAYKEKAVIIRQEEIAHQVYSLWLKTNKIAEDAKPGQFISLYCRDGSRLLPRPISICEINRKEGSVHVVYRVAGQGTTEFSAYHAGLPLEIMGPLGNGFLLQNKKALLIGGGIGIPPLLELAKELNCEKQIVLGYRNQETFLEEKFRRCGRVYLASDDGSIGVKGTVLDAIVNHQLEAEVIYACGPKPMLKAVKEYAAEHQIEAWISLEERMACGVGACLACVCQSKEKDEHSNVHNKRVCKDGPVFLAQEVEL